MEAHIRITLKLDHTNVGTYRSNDYITDLVQRCLAAQIKALPEKLALIRGVALDDWTYSVTVDTTGGF